MSVGLDNLRREILWGAAESVGHAAIRGLLDLGQAKICELEVTLRVEKHVLWLEISVDDTVLVQVLQGQGDLGGVETCSILREADLLAEMEEELASIQEVRDEVKRLRRLEGEVKLHNEGMRDLLHDVSLDLRVVHLVRPDDEVLLQSLHGIDLLRVLFARHVDFAKRASAHNFEQLEIFDAQLFLS